VLVQITKPLLYQLSYASTSILLNTSIIAEVPAKLDHYLTASRAKQNRLSYASVMLLNLLVAKS